MKYKEKQTIIVHTKPAWKHKKGHTTHQSGAGTHQDRRFKRLKTRQSQFNNSIQE